MIISRTSRRLMAHSCGCGRCRLCVPTGSPCTSPICGVITRRPELQANPCCELCYLASDHDQVRITGVAEVVTDRAVLQEIWQANPLMRQCLGAIDHPELILYRIVPNQVRLMREWSLEYHDVPVQA